MKKPILLLLAFTIFFSACGKDSDASTSQVFKFSAIPDQNTTELITKFKPVSAWLSEKLDVKVEYVPVTLYSAAVQQFKNGEIQLAWFGGWTHVQARLGVPGAQALVMGAEDPTFHSYFIAHKDTKLQRSDKFPMGMKGLKFSFGSHSSTSGRLFPTKFVRDATGESPDRFFGAVLYSGSHDKTLQYIASKTADCGAVNYQVYEDRVKQGKCDPETVRVIWQTPDYPDYNFTARPNLDAQYGAGFTAKLTKALLEMPSELTQKFGRSRFIKASNAQFDTVEKIAREVGLLDH